MGWAVDRRAAVPADRVAADGVGRQRTGLLPLGPVAAGLLPGATGMRDVTARLGSLRLAVAVMPAAAVPQPLRGRAVRRSWAEIHALFSRAPIQRLRSGS
jgi:hypothetical protein